LEASELSGLRLARRAYETGRLWASFRRAAFLTLAVGVFAWAFSGAHLLAWLPLTLVAWTLAFWRGETVLRGAWLGFLGGAATFVLPMSVLRPCCVGRIMEPGANCCTMPGMCLLAGTVVGLALAVLVPVTRQSWPKAASGMALGAASIAVLRCSSLFAGEALGLVGGLLAGLLAASAARAVLRRDAVRGA
jgi:hypothetical protein